MAEKQTLVERIRGNAEWELVKFLGGSGMLTAIWQVISAAIKRDPLDWVLWGIVFGVGVFLALVGVWRTYNSNPRMESKAEEAPSQSVQQLNDIEIAELKREKQSLETDLYRSQQARDECEKERREALRKLKESNAKSELLLPIQWEALELAKELRDFHASLGPVPIHSLNPGEETAAYFTRVLDDVTRWNQKLLHAYANRGFGGRITNLMHRLGEEFQYPSYVPNFAENISPNKDSIPKLAQQMEMVAIWINRQQRNEVDLLHEKP